MPESDTCRPGPGRLQFFKKPIDLLAKLVSLFAGQRELVGNVTAMLLVRQPHRAPSHAKSRLKISACSTASSSAL